MKRDWNQADEVPDLMLPETVQIECAHLLAAARPREACALFIGERTAAGHEVSLLAPIRNLATSEDVFHLDPLSWRRVECEARAKGLEVLGVWHSHPRTSARPSLRDLTGAQPGWSHAISAASDPTRIRSYFLSGGRLVEQRVVARVPVA